MDTVFLVNGYGCHLVPEIKQYLNEIVRRIKLEHPSLVITSGGFTNQASAPGVSEARMMEEYLKLQGIDPDLIVREEHAVTTTENLLFSKEIIEKYFPDEIHVEVWCDSIRAFKVRYQARRILGCKVSIQKFDFHRSWKDTLRQWFVSTPLELLGFHFPSLQGVRRFTRLRLNERR